jgi:hypothetical protein
MSKLVLTYRDYGTPGERSTAIFEGQDMTALNYDAEVTAQNTLRDAVNAITLGELAKVTRVAQESPQPGAMPASPFAQRESKWLVRYSDTVTGKKATLEIPCADLAKLDPNSQDRALMTDTDIAAFVTAFEAYVLSPSGTLGNAQVDEIIFVGRKY